VLQTVLQPGWQLVLQQGQQLAQRQVLQLVPPGAPRCLLLLLVDSRGLLLLLMARCRPNHSLWMMSLLLRYPSHQHCCHLPLLLPKGRLTGCFCRQLPLQHCWPQR
jgi:hypothetical protein